MKARSPLVFLFVCVFADMIGYGIVIPLLPLYVQEQGFDAAMIGVLGGGYAAVQALGGPMLSGLSDRYGRRPALLFSIGGTALAYTLLGLAGNFWLLCAALLLDGITGGNLSIAQAYIADTAPEDQRARAFGAIGAAFGLGFMVGPLIGGLLSRFGLAAPAFAAAALATANLCFGLVALPESLPAERRALRPLLAFNPLAQLRDALAQSPLRRLLLMILLINLAFSGLQSNFPIFSGQRFGWNAQDNGLLFAFVGMCAVATQALLLGPARDRLGEPRLVALGSGTMALFLGLVAFAPVGWALFPLAGLAAVGSNMATPTLGSMLLGTTPQEQHGRLLGAQQLVINAALVAGPPLAGAAFEYLGTGAPYLLGGAFAACALLAGIGNPRAGTAEP